jgi:peptidoglycan L-alanyl-D-glutamate endopeptidase CwlK
MVFRLSQKSIERLSDVDDTLVRVVMRAISLTKVDFGVIEGLRTEEKQRELVAAGASQTMNSKHLTGKAVDLMAYINGRGSWELSLYDDIAHAIREAAVEQNVGIRWGAAWIIPDIRVWTGPMETAMNYYIDSRRRQGKRPFIDAPHFELIN